MTFNAAYEKPDDNIPYSFIRNYLRQTKNHGDSFSEYSDFILVFNLRALEDIDPPASNDHASSTHTSQKDESCTEVALEVLKDLLKRITSSGLSVELSNFGSDKISLFITCPQDRLKQESLRSKVHDYLHGMRVPNADQLFNTQKTNIMEDIILTASERIRLVHEILTDSVEENGAGILVSQNPYIECLYPVHDRKFNRTWLKNISTKWRVNFVDLTSIKDHFGEELAYYFAFIDFYFSWLAFPSIIGVICYIYGVTSSSIHGLLNLAWGTIFVEAWSRKQANIAVKWGVNNVSRVEKTRPEFKQTATRGDYLIGNFVPHVSVWKSWLKKIASIPIIFFLGGILSILVVLSFIVEIIINDYYNGPLKSYLTVLPGVVYMVLVNSFSGFYTKLSHRLTYLENHPTVSEHSFYLTQKTFIVNFLVSYLSIFLVAWVYIPYCDEITQFLRSYLPLSSEVTKVGLGRLQAQLFFYVITSQVINFFVETFLPIFFRYTGRTARETTQKIKDRIQEHQAQNQEESDEETQELLNNEVTTSGHTIKGLSHSAALWSLKKFEFEYRELASYDTYDDYAEMVIQFGYIVIFSVVLPLAAVVSYANNWVELRSDSLKIVLSHRRPIPRRVENIGAWLDNMIFLVWIGSFTNGLLVYQFSNISKDLEGYRLIVGLIVAVIWEHGWLIFSHLTKSISSNIPTFAEQSVQAETYQLKTKLMESSGLLSEVTQLQASCSKQLDDPKEHDHFNTLCQQAEALIQTQFKEI